MGSFSDYTEENVLDAVFNIATFVTQSNITVGLSTNDPSDDGGGLAEPSGNAYGRVVFNDWVRTGSVVSNNATITFPQATGSWGTITHFAIFDDAGTPNMLCHGTVNPAQAIVSGNTPSFPTGSLTITLD